MFMDVTPIKKFLSHNQNYRNEEYKRKFTSLFPSSYANSNYIVLEIILIIRGLRKETKYMVSSNISTLIPDNLSLCLFLILPKISSPHPMPFSQNDSP